MNGSNFNWFDKNYFRCNDFGNYDRFISQNLKSAYDLSNHRPALSDLDPNVSYMVNMFSECNEITGEPLCGKYVTNMRNTYRNCRNLTGSPVCGENVTNMDNAYLHCENLTGNPVCGDNVIDMSYAYYNCINLTGTAIIGPQVSFEYSPDRCNSGGGSAYYNCTNLTSAKIYAGNLSYNFTNTRSPISILPIFGRSQYLLVANAFAGCTNMNTLIFYHNNIANLEINSSYPLAGKISTGNPSITVQLECPCGCNSNIINNFDKFFNNLSMVTLNANYAHDFTSNYIAPNGFSVNLI